jgi:hypothetical protein
MLPPMPVLVLDGPPAFSAARLARKLAALRAIEPGIAEAAAHFVHLVDLTQPLDPAGREVLDALLTYGPRPGAGTPRGPLSPRDDDDDEATDVFRFDGLAGRRRTARRCAAGWCRGPARSRPGRRRRPTSPGSAAWPGSAASSGGSAGPSSGG